MVISRSIDYYREAQKQHDELLANMEESAKERATDILGERTLLEQGEQQVAELKEALALSSDAWSAAQLLLEQQRQEAEATKQVMSPMPRRNSL